MDDKSMMMVEDMNDKSLDEPNRVDKFSKMHSPKKSKQSFPKKDELITHININSPNKIQVDNYTLKENKEINNINNGTNRNNNIATNLVLSSHQLKSSETHFLNEFIRNTDHDLVINIADKNNIKVPTDDITPTNKKLKGGKKGLKILKARRLYNYSRPESIDEINPFTICGTDLPILSIKKAFIVLILNIFFPGFGTFIMICLTKTNNKCFFASIGK